MTYSQWTDKSKKGGDNNTPKKDNKEDNGGGFSVKKGRNGLEIVNPKDSFMNVNDDQHFGQFKDQKAAVGIVTDSMNAFNAGVKKILGKNYDKVKGNLAYEFGINRELNGSQFDGSNLIEPMNLGGNSEEVVGDLVSDEQMEQIDNLAEKVGNKIASGLNKLPRINDNEDEGEVSNNSSSNASNNPNSSDNNPFKGNKEGDKNNNLSPIEKNREFIKNYKFDQSWKNENISSGKGNVEENTIDDYLSGKRDLKELYHEGLKASDDGITIRLNTHVGASKKSDLANRMPFEAHGYDYLTLNKSDFKSDADYNKAKNNLIKEFLSSDLFTQSGKHVVSTSGSVYGESSKEAKERISNGVNRSRGFYNKMKNAPGIKTSFKENKVIDNSFNSFW